MSEIFLGQPDPVIDDLLLLERAKITSPVDLAAFDFFYAATQKEGFNMPPSYTWDQFEGGVASFNGISLQYVDSIAAELITNYTAESVKENHSKYPVPMLDALKGPFVRAVHEERKKGPARILANHPTLGSPYLIARSLIEAYQDEFDIDIRPSLYIVEGAYPTVTKFRIKREDGSEMELSPVLLGRCLGNLLITAPKTESTRTEDRAVIEWMRAARANFKIKNHEILTPPEVTEDEEEKLGVIELVIPSGRRAQLSTATTPPFHHIEHLPDSNLDYITDFPVPSFLVGVDDDLMRDPKNPRSEVNIFGDYRPKYLRNKHDVHRALKHCAWLASNDTDRYRLEGWRDQAIRLGKRVVGHMEMTVE